MKNASEFQQLCQSATGHFLRGRALRPLTRSLKDLDRAISHLLGQVVDKFGRGVATELSRRRPRGALRTVGGREARPREVVRKGFRQLAKHYEESLKILGEGYSGEDISWARTRAIPLKHLFDGLRRYTIEYQRANDKRPEGAGTVAEPEADLAHLF